MDKRLVRLGMGLMCLSCFMLVCLLCVGCGGQEKDTAKNAQLTLTPGELSEDAQMLVQALGYKGEVQVFDYELAGAEEDGIQGLSLEVWRYEDGRWLLQVGTMLGLRPEDRVLLINSEEGFWCIAGSQLGYSGGYYCATDIWEKDPDWESWWDASVTRAITLEPGEECFLRALCGEVPVIDEESYKNFRGDLAIEDCVVLTATFES